VFAVARVCRALARLGFCFGLGGLQQIGEEPMLQHNPRQRRYQGPAIADSAAPLHHSSARSSGEGRELKAAARDRSRSSSHVEGRPGTPAGCGGGSSSSSSDFEADPRRLLEKLRWLTETCKAAGEGASPDPSLQVQALALEKECSVWLADIVGSPTPCVCSEARLPHTSVDAVATAIYNKGDRMVWDRQSFVAYEVLRDDMLLPAAQAVASIIYCRMAAPTGLSDRDVVQERFLMKVPGGFAIVMSSVPHAQGDFLGRPAGATGAVRARTVLSGYIVRSAESGGGVVISAASQTDLGGGIPTWAQNVAKKGSKRRLASWAKRLEEYCQQVLAGAALPRGEAGSALKALDSDTVSAASLTSTRDSGAASSSGSSSSSSGTSGYFGRGGAKGRSESTLSGSSARSLAAHSAKAIQGGGVRLLKEQIASNENAFKVLLLFVLLLILLLDSVMWTNRLT